MNGSSNLLILGVKGQDERHLRGALDSPVSTIGRFFWSFRVEARKTCGISSLAPRNRALQRTILGQFLMGVLAVVNSADVAHSSGFAMPTGRNQMLNAGVE